MKKRIYCSISALVALMLVFVGMNDKSEAPAEKERAPDVYVVVQDKSPKANVASLWKDGIVQNLSDGAYANSVFVSGDDVYVAGNEYSEQKGKGVPTYWKNGVAQHLTDGIAEYLSDERCGAFATSIYVSGSDVYVVGYKYDFPELPTGSKKSDFAILWKNGKSQKLNDGTHTAFAKSVFVSGSDVYVAGFENSGKESKWGHKYRYATLWKNGVAMRLSDGSSFAEADSVFVSGQDVYVVGRDDDPTLWKNGIAQRLQGMTLVESVFVSGNDVYVAGWKNGSNNIGMRVAAIWKNGEVQELSQDTRESRASSIFVSGSDVYVAGLERDPKKSNKEVAVLWKNGVAEYLSDGSRMASARSVFVSDNNVLVARNELSQEKYVASYWKNGKTINVSDGSFDAYAKSIFVSGSDVYVVGWEIQAEHKSAAMLWVNGVAQCLSRGKSYSRTRAESVFVSGEDVYVVGYLNGRGTLWKNGVVQPFQDAKGWPQSVYVSGEDVYVAGHVRQSPRDIATLWKNGIPQYLGKDNYSYAYGVFVSGDDVYVAGRDGSIGTIWKNGKVYQTLNGKAVSAEARSIFVSEGDVYVVGSKHGEGAVLWKNGVVKALFETRWTAVAESVFVSGKDVYVVGRGDNDGRGPTARLFKNGVEQKLNLPSEYAEALAVFVK